MKRHLLICPCITAALLTACGGGSPAPKQIVHKQLVTIWSSFPHRGPQAGQSAGYERAIKGALYDLKSINPSLRIRYVPLDDSTAEAGGWDAGLVAENARRAARNTTTVAYIGDADSNATAVALPILNQFGVLMVTPTSTARGLTLSGNGAGPGEPFQYYPSGKRTLVRLVPQDSLQARVLMGLMKRDGCRTAHLYDDSTAYGTGLSQLTKSQLVAAGIKVASTSLGAPAAVAGGVVSSTGADCILYSGESGSSAVVSLTRIAATDPQARLYAPDALVNQRLAAPSAGGLSRAVAQRLEMTAPLGSFEQYPPVGRSVMRNVAGMPGNVSATGAVSAYAAAELVARCLAATSRIGAKPLDRGALVRLAIGREHHSAAVGTYVVSKRGDSTIKRYGRFVIRAGRVVFGGALSIPQTPAAPSASKR